MGSSNVACFVSGISINGTEPVYYIPLILKDEPEDKLQYAAFYGIHRPTNFFAPATFPILGEYDTYGGLENIVRDKNVEHLEKYYNMNIERIINPEGKIFNGGVFILKSVYDLMVNNFVGEFGPAKNQQYEIEDRIKYCSQYGHKVRKAIRNKFTMLKICKQLKDNSPIQIESAEKYKTESLAEIKNIKDSFDVTFSLDRGVLLEEMPNIKKVYFNKIVNGILYQPFLELNMLYIALHATSKMYFPTVNGPQGGNDYMVKKLAILTNKLLTAKIKDRD